MWCDFSISISNADSERPMMAPAGLTWKEAWGWLEGMLLKPQYHKHCTVELGIGYKDQCNLEFSSREIHALSDSNATLTISCYKVDECPDDRPAKSR